MDEFRMGVPKIIGCLAHGIMESRVRDQSWMFEHSNFPKFRPEVFLISLPWLQTWPPNF